MVFHYGGKYETEEDLKATRERRRICMVSIPIGMLRINDNSEAAV